MQTEQSSIYSEQMLVYELSSNILMHYDYEKAYQKYFAILFQMLTYIFYQL